jgi:hypothetical protein
MKGEAMPDEPGREPYYRTERAFWAVLPAIGALAIGTMGTCGVINTIDGAREHQNEYAFLGLMFGIPSALVGLVGVFFCLRTIYRRYRRR